MADQERIIFERAGDGEHWRLIVEGGDVEGHVFKFRGFSAEPAGEEGGERVYKLDFSGDDAEGHRFRWSDARLKREIRPL